MDIRADHLEIVQDILRTHLPAGVEVWVFGSRERLDHEATLDLDLAVPGVGTLDEGFMTCWKSLSRNRTSPTQATWWTRLNGVSFHREIEQGYVIVQRGGRSQGGLWQIKLETGRHQ